MIRWCVAILAALWLAAVSPALATGIAFAGLQEVAPARFWFFEVPQAICMRLFGPSPPSTAAWVVACAAQYLAVAAVLTPFFRRGEPDGASRARAFEAAVTQFHAE